MNQGFPDLLFLALILELPEKMRTVLVLGGIWLLNFLRVCKAMPPVPLADTYSRVRVDAVAVAILQHQFDLCQMFIYLYPFAIVS